MILDILLGLTIAVVIGVPITAGVLLVRSFLAEIMDDRDA